jgi:sugar/nucleoside kinase (ribokinase family)
MNSENQYDDIKKLLDCLPREKLLYASARIAPIVGASIAELLPIGDNQKIVSAMQQITEDQTERLLKQLQNLIKEADGQNNSPIVVIGSGNLEMLLHSPNNDSITLGAKHSVKVESIWGGSGVNFTTRLLSVGRMALTVLPIANDQAGKQIIHAMKSAAEEGCILDEIQKYWSNMSLFNSEVYTPTTVLLIHGTDRTVFRQEVKTGDRYIKQMKNQIDKLFSICKTPSALMIGHVPCGSETSESTAEVIDYLINKYKNKTLIYSVLGSSQLKLGWRFWEKHIRNNISVFQLNLSEAKFFFGDSGKPATTDNVLNKLRQMRVSAVLTVDKFGAIAIHSQSEDIYMALPVIDSADVLDSTGAGDAFAAGMASVLYDIGAGYTKYDFKQALAEGSRWASAACTIQGGAGRWPGKELAGFIDRNERCRYNNVEIRTYHSLREILTFLDRVYD